MRISMLLSLMGLVALVGGGCERAASARLPAPGPQASAPAKGGATMSERVVKSDAEWKKELTPEQFHVLREKGTERAFTGPYWNSHEHAKYVCAACGLELFSSDTKFDSGTGWPSFSAPATPGAVDIGKDNSLFMERDEVKCHRCGGHLGHVFDDGPRPTGQRYCINGTALKQVKADDKK